MPNKSWYSRNKKWFLPAIIVGPILMFGSFVFLLIIFVMGIFKDSDSYKMSMHSVRENKDCVRLLGEPIKEDYWVTGSINTSGFWPERLKAALRLILHS